MKETEQLTSADLVLQSVWRGCLARRSVAAKLHAVVRIQALFRGNKVRLEFSEERRKYYKAATVIQVNFVHIYTGLLQMFSEKGTCA